MQLALSFYTDPTSDSGLNIYEQVYNASIFSLYLPFTNVADTKHAFPGRNYTDTEFYHTLLMSNHMESDPMPFANGIRGKVLWHNEYRSQAMYGNQGKFGDRMFAAAFAPNDAGPFHNNTCTGVTCVTVADTDQHREQADAALQEFMNGDQAHPSRIILSQGKYGP
jgi:hypothetical protein